MLDYNEMVSKLKEGIQTDLKLKDQIIKDLELQERMVLQQNEGRIPIDIGYSRPMRHDVCTPRELERALLVSRNGDSIRLLNNIDYNVVGGVFISGKHITIITNGYTLNIIAIAGRVRWSDVECGNGLTVEFGAVMLDDSNGGELNVTAANGFSGVATFYSDVTVTNAIGRDWNYTRGWISGVLSGSNGKITVKKNAMGCGCAGVCCIDGGKVDVMGDVSGDKIGIINFGGRVYVRGDVDGHAGVYSSNSGVDDYMNRKTEVEIRGNIRAAERVIHEGTIGIAAVADYCASIIVGGDITALFGTYVYNKGFIQVEGRVNSPVPECNLGGTIKISKT
jgi:hypothetical protein